ncbi:MAG: hypothetical protein J6X18_09065 [Bacteroidales bacterium]|nr:hypothetical protein [Bacteroidales bacterium]
MNNDITIIIPVHEVNDENTRLFKRAVESVKECQKHYKAGKLVTTVVSPLSSTSCLISGVSTESTMSCDKWITNDSGDTSYCGQVNYAVQHIDTKYFSILEFDDEYLEKWFKFFEQYLYGNEDISVFLPLNIVTDESGEHWQYGNEAPLAEFFSSEPGIVDFDCLQDWSGFTLPGAIVNREDFINVGMYKPSIKLAHDYELLMRMTNRKLRVMVVPKEGYKHIVGRNGSLTDIYRKEMEGTDDVQKWFDLAKREYQYTEDRKKGILGKKNKEELK